MIWSRLSLALASECSGPPKSLRVGVDVVDGGPIGGDGLGGEAVGVDGGAHGPGMDGKGEVAVNDADLFAVAVGEGGKELGVHAGAVRALEIVEGDDLDGGGLGATAEGTAGAGDELFGVLRDVVFVELGEGVAVF